MSETQETQQREHYKAPFPCLKCGKELENLCHPESTPNQPIEACTFNSSGHYGSQVFDELDGARIEVNICDDCLMTARAAGNVGYWPGHPRRKLKIWEGE